MSEKLSMSGLSTSLASGRFEIVSLRGSGGMGAVYEAWDKELERRVALKCVLDVSRPESRERARQEARVVASLSHPNLPRIHDVLIEGQQVWMVSEWIEGKTIDEFRLPMSTTACLACAVQLFEALASAHGQGVMHRDVKPSNVLLDPHGRLVLIDFGVAFASGVSSGLTIAGSPRYADPRLLAGQTLDAGADIFSACLVILELLTGKTVLPELSPLPLYRFYLEHFEQELSANLDGLYPPLAIWLWRGLAPSQADHRSGAEEMAQALTECLRAITSMPAGRFLKHYSELGEVEPAECVSALQASAMQALERVDLSPADRARWMAYQGDHAINPMPSLKSDAEKTQLWLSLKLLSRSRRRMVWTVTACLALAVVGAGLVLRVKTQAPVAALTPPRSPVVAVVAPAATPTPSVVKALTKPPKQPLATRVQLTIAANAWADVFIDEQPQGRLPSARPFVIRPGSHQIRLESPYVAAWEQTVVVPAEPTYRLQVYLEHRNKPVTLKLASAGRLYVDGRELGPGSEHRLFLDLGTHRIRVVRAGQPDRWQDVIVSPTSPEAIDLDSKEKSR